MRAKQWRQGVLIGVLLLAVFWLATSIMGLIGKANVAVSEAQEAKRQYQALEARRVILEANLAALATDRGQDAAIRGAFGVVRPGEEVIVVVPPEAKVPPPPPSWWQRMLDWF